MTDLLMSIAQSFGPWVALCGVLVWQGIVREKAMRGDLQALERRLEKNELFIRTELSQMIRELLVCVTRNTEAYEQVLERLDSPSGDPHAKFQNRSSERK